MSQEALAGRANIDRSYMSSVERGLRNVSVLNLARIAEALEVPVWELLRPRDVRPAVVARGWQPRYLSLG
jgi:transcriptional regulator with XRE-family HTH domain